MIVRAGLVSLALLAPVAPAQDGAPPATDVESVETPLREAERALHALDASLLTTRALCGALDDAERERVASLLDGASGALDRAGAALERSIGALESDPGLATDAAARDALSELRVRLGAFRLPLARAQAQLLRAALAAGERASREQIASAARALAEVSFQGETERKRLALLASARLALDDADATIDAGGRVDGEGIWAFHTRLAEALARARTGERAATERTLTRAEAAAPRSQDRSESLWLGIAAQTRVRAEAALGGADASDRAERAARRWLDGADAEGYARRLSDALPALREALHGRPERTLGALSLVARADATRDAARRIELLERAAQDEGGGVGRAEALWRLGRPEPAIEPALEGSPPDAMAERRATLFLEHPDWPLAYNAARAACSTAHRLAPERRRAVLESALERYGDRADTDGWRYELAEVVEPERALSLLDAIGDPRIRPRANLLAARVAAERFRETGEHARTAAVRAETALDALDDGGFGDAFRASWRSWLLRALAEALCAQDRFGAAAERALGGGEDGAEAARWLLGEALERAREAERRADEDARRAIARSALPLLEVAGAGDATARARVALLTLAGEAERALQPAERLVERTGGGLDARLLRAEALFGAERYLDAFADYRAVAEALERDGDRSDAFWRSWSRILTVLLFNDPSGERRASIRREVERLRRIDPDLGGPPHRARIERVASAIDGSQD